MAATESRARSRERERPELGAGGAGGGGRGEDDGFEGATASKGRLGLGSTVAEAKGIEHVDVKGLCGDGSKEESNAEFGEEEFEFTLQGYVKVSKQSDARFEDWIAKFFETHMFVPAELEDERRVLRALEAQSAWEARRARTP